MTLVRVMQLSRTLSKLNVEGRTSASQAKSGDGGGSLWNPKGTLTNADSKTRAKSRDGGGTFWDPKGTLTNGDSRTRPARSS